MTEEKKNNGKRTNGNFGRCFHEEGQKTTRNPSRSTTSTSRQRTVGYSY